MPDEVIGYFCNQHPMASTTFVRREIAAVEALCVPVRRYAIRPWPGELVDPDDRVEATRTRYILSIGPPRLLGSLATTALGRPAQFLRALGAARRLAKAGGGGLARHLIYLAEACVLRSWTGRDGISHLHTHFGTNSAAVAMLCRLLGGPHYSFTVHGPEEFDDPVGLALGEKIRHARFAVAISSYGRSQLWRWASLDDWPKIEIIHCGLGAEYIDAEPTPIPDVPRFVNIGRLVEQKGQALLLEAAALLRDRGLAFEVVIIGGGELCSVLERRIEELDLGRFVQLAGWRTGEQIREALHNSRAMLLPSFAEGLPVVLMEALALGRPVITTAIAGIPELVRDGDCGWLVTPGSVLELADAMAEALAMPPDRLGEMGLAGAARVRERHDSRIEAGKLLARILSDDPGSHRSQAEP